MKSDLLCENCGKSYCGYCRTARHFCSRQCAAISRRLTKAQFWARIEREVSIRAVHLGTPCWIYTGPFNPVSGYGQVGNSGTAHRLAYKLTHGRLPKRPKQVLHRCDVKLCCRPDHLYAGTQKQNIADAIERGRMAPASKTAHFGEANGNAKLTAADVKAIRREFPLLPRGPKGRVRNGLMTAFAERFGVTREMIYAISHNENWRQSSTT